MSNIISGNGMGIMGSSYAQLSDLPGGDGVKYGQAGERLFINVANGNLVYRGHDEMLYGVGFNLDVFETYNSRGQSLGGSDWSLSVVSKLQHLSGSLNTEGSSIERVTGDGHIERYVYDNRREVYVCQDADGSAYFTLRIQGTEWVWESSDKQIHERYNAEGQLLERTDAEGHTVSYHYDGKHLAEMVDASGEKVAFSYTGDLLNQITFKDKDGNVINNIGYHYDVQGRLIRTEYTENGKTYSVRYTYDGDSDRIASITQDDGTTISLTYIEIDGQFRIHTLSDGNGHKTTYDYDLAHHTTTITDALGRKTETIYDDQGRIKTIVGPAVNGQKSTTSYEYEEHGNVKTVTDGVGNTTRFIYDEKGNCIEVDGANGSLVKRTYDDHNRLVSETRYRRHDEKGKGLEPQISYRIYDDKGHLRYTVSAEGRVVEYCYDVNGNLVSQIQYSLGHQEIEHLPSLAEMEAWAEAKGATHTERTDYTYDFRGQVSSITHYGCVKKDGTGDEATAQTVKYIYDARGQLIQKILTSFEGKADGAITYYVYDELGRLTLTTDAHENNTRVQYDDSNHQIITTSANGLEVTVVYDAAGHVVSSHRTDTVNAHDFGTIHYFYDNNGRLICTQDAEGARTYILYDEAGRISAKVNTLGQVSEFVYDKAGHVIKTLAYQTAANTQTWLTTEDDKTVWNNVTLNSIRPQSTSEDRVTRNVYDSNGRVVFQIDSEGFVTEFHYDDENRLISQKRYAEAIDLSQLPDVPQPKDIAPAKNADDRLIRYFYDRDGNKIGELSGEGSVTEYHYNAAGLLTEETHYANRVPPEKLSQLTDENTLDDCRPRIQVKDIRLYYFYNAARQLIGKIDGDHYLTEYRYDDAGNLTQTIAYADTVNDQKWKGITDITTLDALRPESGSADRIIHYHTNDVGLLVLKQESFGSETIYEYDGEGHLIRQTTHNSQKTFNSENIESREVRYRYDAEGNITEMLDAKGVVLLNQKDLTNVERDRIWKEHAIHYYYDNNGRRLRQTDRLGQESFFYYDTEGRLSITVNAEGDVEETRYNAFGQVSDKIRYAKKLSSDSLETLTGGDDSEVAALVSDLADASTDQHVIYEYNTRGDVKVITNANHSIETLNDTDAFGNLIRKTQKINDGETVVTEYHYDHQGQLRFQNDDVHGFNREVGLKYDAFGRVSEKIDGNKNRITFEYDHRGNVIEISNPLHPLSYTYDAFSRQITVKDGNRTVTFSYDDAGRTLITSFEDGSSTKIAFDVYGEKVSFTDGNQNTTNYYYDKNGNLTDVVDPMEHTVHTDYDDADRASTVTDANGNTTTYTYDAANRVLTKTLDPNGLKLVTKYTYDGVGRALTITDPNQYETQFIYDADGRLIQKIVDPKGLHLVTAFEYDGLGRQITVRQGSLNSKGDSFFDRETHYIYDHLNRLTQKVSDPNGLKITENYTYDSNDNITIKIDANGHITHYAYNANNKLIYTVDALGFVTENQYDTNDQLIAQTHYAIAIDSTQIEPKGIISQIQKNNHDRTIRDIYDALGRVTYHVSAEGMVSEYRYDAAGNVLGVVNHATKISSGEQTLEQIQEALGPDTEKDRITTMEYDTANRLWHKTDAGHYETTYEYDGNGNVKTKTDANGVWTYTYDANNRVKIITSPKVDVSEVQFINGRYQTVTTQQGIVTAYDYDANGQLVLKTTAQGMKSEHKIEYTYDANGRLTTQTVRNVSIDNSGDVGNHDAARHEKAGDLTTHYYYDDAGNTVAVEDPAGNVSYNIYNALNQLVYKVDNRHAVSAFQYDSAGNVTQQTSYANAIAADLTRKQYNVDEIQSLLKSSTEDRTIQLKYDGDNRVTLKTSPETLTYDAETRKYSKQRAQTQLIYNAFGDIVSQSQLVNAERDQWSRQIFTYNNDGKLTAKIDALGYVTEYQYDQFGNVIDQKEYANATKEWDIDHYQAPETSSDDREVQYTYDALNRVLTQTQVNASYATLDGKTVNLHLNDLTTTYTYNANGKVTSQTDAQGNSTYYYYDALDRLTAKIDPNIQKGMPATTYQYDATDHLVSQKRWARGALSADKKSYQLAGDSTEDQLNLAVYDAQDHVLQTIDGEQHTTQYSYDAIGNLTRKWQVLHEIDGSVVIADQRFRYDENGNITHQLVMKDDGKVDSHDTQYNAFGEVTAHGTNGDYFEFYHYNNAGQLWRTNEKNGVWRINVYNVQGQIAEQITTAANSGDDHHGLDLSKDEFKILEDFSTDHWKNDLLRKDFLYDANGRVVKQITQATNDGAPELMQSNELDRWGNVIAYTDVMKNTFRYQYDHNNHLIEKTDPLVESVDEQGVATQINPHTFYYYDALGRNIAIKDANQHTVSQVVDANGNVVQKNDARGYATTYQYDLFNNLHMQFSALNEPETLDYDHNNRLLKKTDARGFPMTYTYDEAGNQTSVTRQYDRHQVHDRFVTQKSVYNSEHQIVRSLSVDRFGRPIETNYGYDDDGHLVYKKLPDAGLIQQQMALTWKYDHFGHELTHSDLAGRQYTTSYDQSFSVVEKTTTATDHHQQIEYTYYANGTVKHLEDRGGFETKDFNYYDNGLLKHEVFEKKNSSNSVISHQESDYTYDALNRLRNLSRVYQGNNERLTIEEHYDAVGNIRHAHSELGTNGQSPRFSKNDWYSYDEDNRVLISGGYLDGTTIRIRANQGSQASYDAVGNRAATDVYEGNRQRHYTFHYDADHHLVSEKKDGFAQFLKTYDGSGNVIDDYEYASGTTYIVNAYMNGYLGMQRYYANPSQYDPSSFVSYDYYQNGNLKTYAVSVGGSMHVLYKHVFSYEGFEGAEQHDERVLNKDGGLNSSVQRVYDANGHLTAITGNTGSGTINYETDTMDGVIERGGGGENSIYVYANGHLLARVDRNATTSEGALTVYGGLQSESDVKAPMTIPGTYTVETGDSLERIAEKLYGDKSYWYLIADANGIIGSPSDVAGGGISERPTLSIGQVLMIPSGQKTVHHTSETHALMPDVGVNAKVTFEVPQVQAPQHHHKGCGTFGVILMAAVAVVATIATAGAFAVAAGLAAPTLGGLISGGIAVLGGSAGLGSVAIGFVAGAVGSAASQLTGLATGNLDHFSWSGVAIGGLATAVTAGMGSLLSKLGTAVSEANQGLHELPQWLKGGAIMATSDAASQGGNMLAGNQKDFNWTEFWASAISGGVMGAVGDKLKSPNNPVGKLLMSEGKSEAGAFLDAGLRAAMGDKSFTFNAGDISAGALGSGLGNGLMETLPAPAETMSPEERAWRQQVAEEHDAYLDSHPYTPIPQDLGYDPIPSGELDRQIAAYDQRIAEMNARAAYQQTMDALGASETGENYISPETTQLFNQIADENHLFPYLNENSNSTPLVFAPNSTVQNSQPNPKLNYYFVNKDGTKQFFTNSEFDLHAFEDIISSFSMDDQIANDMKENRAKPIAGKLAIGSAVIEAGDKVVNKYVLMKQLRENSNMVNDILMNSGKQGVLLQANYWIAHDETAYLNSLNIIGPTNDYANVIDKLQSGPRFEANPFDNNSFAHFPSNPYQYGKWEYLYIYAQR